MDDASIHYYVMYTVNHPAWMNVEPVAQEIPGFHPSSPDLSVVSGIY